MRSRPLTQYVLKVHSRCDLACDHCYVYRHADQSWRGRPRAIDRETVRAAAARIAEHARAHRLRRVRVVLHGGEPLLLGPVRLRALLAQLTATIAPVAELDLRMQSNGVLLTPALCELLAEYGVRVGISLDGDAEANDRHRRFADGTGSHAQVRRALALLRRPEYRRSYAGLLCTIDVRNDPIRVYEALLAEEPPRIDLLLPHATWNQPPYRPDGAATPYADWLYRIYRRWLADGRPVPIRLFDSLISTAAGGPSGTEAVGLDPADLVVIETDGAWELADSMKTTYDGAAGTGLDVFAHAVDEVAGHPEVAVRSTGLAELCQTCRQCPVVRQCGGGLRAHRYRDGTGFDNPSAYCADLKELIRSMNLDPPPAVPAVGTGAEPAAGAVDLLPQGQVRAALLDDLGSGPGSAATVGSLAASQLAIVRALLAEAAGGLTGAVPARAWELLGQLDGAAPEAVDAVLAHPYARGWVQGRLDPRTAAATDPAHLAALAAAAAIQAGVSTDVEVPARSGLLWLPGLGALALDQPAGGGTVRLAVDAAGFVAQAGDRTVRVPLDGSGPTPPGWQPARFVEAESWRLLVEDLDPYRDCYDRPATARLTPERAATWRRHLAAAAALVRRDVPGHLPGLRVGLRAVTPLADDPHGRLHSGTSRHAFGAVGTVLAPAEELAVLLVHEFQHVKLGAVLDLCDLVDPTERVRLVVPWRPDPRPVEGVLQGTYAHLAIAEIWRARPGDVAAERFRMYRDWTAGAVEALLATGGLTGDGERFVRRMGETVAAWADRGERSDRPGEADRS
ncbi:FxsB family cyclophane-forming radical SAM/SPASM peptide maturase [Micromonospora sp. NPDC049559]|uniref:FxsB family cyclophane-forming radical SAM/SPASM peptide maturase n=1 Tax=Micromonospora sp. NPDC049559 TaxID=3155923 RepID=UPI00343D6104